MLKNRNDRLIARQDLRMDLEWDSSFPIIMISPMDSAIAPCPHLGPSCRFEPLAGEKPLQTSLQLPGIRLEEFDILGHLDSIPPGDGDRLLDRALQTAPVLLPPDLGALSADPEGATGAEDPPFKQDISDPMPEPPKTHRGRGSSAEARDAPEF